MILAKYRDKYLGQRDNRKAYWIEKGFVVGQGVIRQECDAIPHTMQSLQNILETNQQQIKELENHLQAFVAMRDAAVIAIPTIQEKVDEISEQLRVGALNMHKGAEDITQAATHVSSELEVSAQKISGSSEKVASVADTLNQQMQHTSQTLLDSTQSIQTALTEGANQLKTSVADSDRRPSRTHGRGSNERQLS